MKTITRPFTLSILRSAFFAIGIVIQIGAIVGYQNTNSFIAKSIKAEGTIIDLEHANSRTYKPVVRFNTQDGKVVEFTSSVGTSPPSYSIGEKVEIRYLSNDLKMKRILFSGKRYGNYQDALAIANRILDPVSHKRLSNLLTCAQHPNL